MTNVPEIEIEGLLAEAEVDYLNLSLIEAAVSRSGVASTPEEVWEETMRLLGRMLDAGFLAVDLTHGGGCKPWPDQDRDAILARLRQRWESGEDEGSLGMTHWYDLPDDRREAARAALARG